MAAYLSLTSNAPGAEEYVLVDGPPFSPWVLREESDWGDAVWDHAYSGEVGTRGSRAAQGKLLNRRVIILLSLDGDSVDDTAAHLSALDVVMNDLRRYGGKVTRRGHGQTYRQHLRVLAGDGVQSGTWGHQLDMRYHLRPVLEFVCEPYWEEDPCDVRDDFTVSLDAYTADAGTVGNLAVSASGLRATAALNESYRLLHTANGHTFSDAQVTVGFTMPSAGLPVVSAILKRTASDTYLEARVTTVSGASNDVLSLHAWEGGVEVWTDDLTAFDVSDAGWLVARLEGMVLTAKVYGADPSPGATPLATIGTTLTGLVSPGAFDPDVEGTFGFAVTPASADTRVNDFRLEPWTYRDPDTIQTGHLYPSGEIRGDAPALVDVEVTVEDATPPKWALIGWTGRPSAFNRVVNGDFEDGSISPWIQDPLDLPDSGPTILAEGRYGTGGLQFTSDSGAGGVLCNVVGRFRAGITFVVNAWVKAPASTSQVCRLSIETASGAVTEFTEAQLTTSWQLLSVSFLVGGEGEAPAAEDWIQVRIAHNGPSAVNQAIYVDGVEVIEEARTPTALTQVRGSGAHPPFGIIPALGAQVSTGWATTGTGGLDIAASEGDGSLSWLVDPALLPSDDYAQGELDVEAWLSLAIPSTLTGTLNAVVSCAPSAGTAYGSRRYARILGSGGRDIATPSSGTPSRLVRLGVLPMSVEQNATRWLVTVDLDWTGGTGDLQVDYLALVPVRSRALGVTGKPTTGYPAFIDSSAETTRVIRSDRSGLTGKPTSRERFPDHGLAGSAIEIPPGAFEALVLLQSRVPDDPGSDALGKRDYEPTVHFKVTPRWHHLRGDA